MKRFFAKLGLMQLLIMTGEGSYTCSPPQYWTSGETVCGCIARELQITGLKPQMHAVFRANTLMFALTLAC